MGKKYQIAENRVIDIDAIQDADMQKSENGVTVVTFRFSGLERPLRIQGKLADTLWFAVVANAVPIFAVTDDPASAEAAQ